MIDQFDREPTLLVGDHPLTPARFAATAAAGLPAVGLGLLCLSQGVLEADMLSADALFHLALGAALLLLFGEVALAIHRADSLGWILLFGVVGFAGAFAAVLLAEFGGPAVLGVLVVLVAAWTLATSLVRRHKELRER